MILIEKQIDFNGIYYLIYTTLKMQLINYLLRSYNILEVIFNMKI